MSPLGKFSARGGCHLSQQARRSVRRNRANSPVWGNLFRALAATVSQSTNGNSHSNGFKLTNLKIHHHRPKLKQMGPHLSIVCRPTKQTSTVQLFAQTQNWIDRFCRCLGMREISTNCEATESKLLLLSFAFSFSSPTKPNTLPVCLATGNNNIAPACLNERSFISKQAGSR